MKKIIWCIAASGLIMMQSCEEKDVPIDFSDPSTTVGLKDTAYTAAVETAQSRIVLLEEFTGAGCANCPQAHAIVDGILNTNKDRVVAMAYHTNGGGSIFKPVNKDGIVSKYDFRNEGASNIASFIYGGVGAIPIGGVDRIVVSESRQLPRSSWAKDIADRLPLVPPVNIHLSSAYDADNNLVTVKVKVAYTKEVTTSNALTIGIIESNIIDAQEYDDSVVANYVHNHVLRKFLTKYDGAPVLDNISAKQPGQVYEYTYIFVPDETWNKDNCSVVAFVSNTAPDDKLVLQAAETHLK